MARPYGGAFTACRPKSPEVDGFDGEVVEDDGHDIAAPART